MGEFIKVTLSKLLKFVPNNVPSHKTFAKKILTQESKFQELLRIIYLYGHLLGIELKVYKFL